jgi:hypothetical protein
MGDRLVGEFGLDGPAFTGPGQGLPGWPVQFAVRKVITQAPRPHPHRVMPPGRYWHILVALSRHAEAEALDAGAARNDTGTRVRAVRHLRRAQAP